MSKSLTKLLRTLCLSLLIACTVSYAGEQEEFDAMIQAAQNGDPDAEVALGQCYLEGYGVEQSDTIAASLFAKATQKGHTEGTYLFGCMLLNGLGVDQNIEIALSILNDAKEAGSTDAATMLGSVAESGFGDTPPDYEAAIGFYIPASEAGNAKATYALAAMCRDGKGMEQDLEAAKEGFQEAINQGSVDACVALANLIVYTEEESEANINRVHDLLTVAAENGNEEAIEMLSEFEE